VHHCPLLHFPCPALGRGGKLNAMTEAKAKRRWFQFSIRELLLVTTTTPTVPTNQKYNGESCLVA
jgi:hypothetical protein